MILFFAIIKLWIHLLTNGNYGFHRDEFLYLAMSEHLARGYGETPPFIAAVAYTVRHSWGDSLSAIRFLPAVFGSGIVLLTGLMVRHFGGRWFALILAMLSVIFTPVFLLSHSLFQPSVFYQFYVAAIGYLLIRWLTHPGQQKIWLLTGILFGLGMLTDYAFLVCGAALIVALLLSPQRNIFRTPYVWMALGISVLIFLPNLVWQINNQFSMLEYFSRVNRSQLPHLSHRICLPEQLFLLQPVIVLLGFVGLVYFFVTRQGRKYIVLGWMSSLSLFIFLLWSGKVCDSAPMFPVLFAAGAVGIERWLRSRRWHGFIPIVIVFVLLNGIIFAPYGLPVLPVRHLESYTHFWSNVAGLNAPLGTGSGKTGPIPRYFADMFGWEEQAAHIARVYQQLTPEDQEKCVILAGNYGEAGALDYYGKRYDLPPVVSYQGSYYRWGPGENSGEVAIAVGVPLERLKPVYKRIRRKTVIRHDYAAENETDVPVYLCRKPVKTLSEVWKNWRVYREEE